MVITFKEVLTNETFKVADCKYIKLDELHAKHYTATGREVIDVFTPNNVVTVDRRKLFLG